ncbi:MAG: AAA family ATPase, partial [Alphaproteobacteria bacterium]|nr:AAA family ATPase [Alphaproteobacteria bacterium]
MSAPQKTAVLHRMVMSDHVCPYGQKSLWLLRRKGYAVQDHHLKTREETDAFKGVHGVKTTPQTFIGGVRIGGHDDLRRFFGEKVPEPGATSYVPVIAVFAVAALIALAIDWLSMRAITAMLVPNFIAVAMCLLAMLPWYDNPLGLKVQREPSNILWLDYEADRTSTLYNFTRIVRGADAEGISLNYRRCRMPLCDDIEAISLHVEQAKTDIVIIDSVAKAAGGDLDKSESPNRLFAALDLLHCTPLILAHTYKGEGTGKRTIYGS